MHEHKLVWHVPISVERVQALYYRVRESRVVVDRESTPEIFLTSTRSDVSCLSSSPLIPQSVVSSCMVVLLSVVSTPSLPYHVVC